MPANKNTAEQAAEATRLAAMKPAIPRSSLFGDDNHAAVEAQIYVLEHHLDEDTVDRRYDFGPDAVRHAALDACFWAAGHEPESPADSWALLTR